MIVAAILLFLFLTGQSSPSKLSDDNEFYSTIVERGVGAGRRLTAANIPPSELDSLSAFYSTTNGTGWIWDDTQSGIPWNFTVADPNPCADGWQGLQCSCNSTVCHIISMELVSHGLTGPLEDSLTNLTHLTYLSLANNSLLHTLPSSLGQLAELQLLDLRDNLLRGTIPHSLANLSELLTLNLSVNFLNGTIPRELFQMPRLSSMDLQYNHLIGMLPEDINLANISTLELSYNFLGGSIPEVFGTLLTLRVLGLDYNHLTGTLPSFLGNLVNLQHLLLGNSFFNGTIPTSFIQLQALETLVIGGNYLTGPIPAFLGNMSSLTVIDLSRSYFDATIPKEIAQLVNLTSFDVSTNLLHGHIPQEFVSLQSLRYLGTSTQLLSGNLSMIQGFPNMTTFEMSSNYFSGPMPETSWPLLEIMSVEFNSMTGTVPLPCSRCPLTIVEYSKNSFIGGIAEGFGDMKTITHFAVDHNQLNGPIPDTFADLPFLAQFVVNSNFLTGTLPESLVNNTLLAELNVSSNFLHGTLPEELGFMPSLVELDLSQNNFHGPLPATINQLRFLQVLFLADNQLTGPLDDLVNATHQLFLQNIDVSHNQFTGSLPVQAFQGKALHSFAAAVNCMGGYVPEEICEAKNLSALVLDGLGTAQACRQVIFPNTPYLNAYTIDRALHGTIPDCIFFMESMRSLHLSGNHLTGSLPQGGNYSSGLTYLSLSNNLLQGKIPLALQIKGLTGLDLSYNRFSGVLDSDFRYPINGSTLSLEVNRLSGDIPSSLYSAETISILNGNIFYCSTDRSSLPDNDPYRDKYECGSDAVNRSLYITLGVLAIPIILAIAIIYRRRAGQSSEDVQTNREYLQACWESWKALDHKMRLDRVTVSLPDLPAITVVNYSIKDLMEYFADVRRLYWTIGSGIVLLLIPVYSVLSIYSSTYDNVYGWQISAVLLAGNGATVVLCLCFSLILALVVVYALKHKPLADPTATEPADRAVTARRALYLLLVGVINLTVMIAADCLYVYIVLNYNGGVVFIVQMLMAAFKVLWNEQALWALVPYLKGKMLVPMEKPKSEEKERERAASVYRSRSDSVMRPTMTIGRYTCYGANGSEDPPQIDAIEQRLAITDMEFDTIEVPFLAFNTLLNNIIVPATAIACISSTCFNNALIQAGTVNDQYLVVLCLEYRESEQYDVYACTSTEPSVISVSYDPPFIYSYQCASMISLNFTAVFIYMFIIVGVMLPVAKLTLSHGIRQLAADRRKSLAAWLPMLLRPAFAESEQTPFQLFRKEKNVVRYVAYLGTMVTFGGIYPPLAAIVCLAICTATFTDQYLLGNLLTEADGLGFLWYRLQLLSDSEGVAALFYPTIWQIMPFAGAIFGYLIFDTLGYSNGWKDALIAALLTIAVWCLLMKLVVEPLVRKYWLTPSKPSRLVSQELQQVSFVGNPITESRRITIQVAESGRGSIQVVRSSNIGGTADAGATADSGAGGRSTESHDEL